MVEHRSTWQFDESHLTLRNGATGDFVDLRDLDTSDAVLAQVTQIGRSAPDGNAREFTKALRHACRAVFNLSLRQVYCQAGNQTRVDWQARLIVPEQTDPGNLLKSATRHQRR